MNTFFISTYNLRSPNSFFKRYIFLSGANAATSMSAFQLSVFQKLLKFAIVGASGLCIDFSVTWLCREKLRFNQYVANAAGFSLAVCSNFFLNYIWTFKGQSENITIAFGSFLSIALLGLLLNTGALYLCNHVFGLEFYRSKIIAVAVVFLWNFGANYLITFRNKPVTPLISSYHLISNKPPFSGWNQI